MNDRIESAWQPLRLIWPLLIALVATFSFLTIPRYPYLITDALSYEAVLSYAHEHRLQFGADIVFSYGPLGFLVNRSFFPHASTARLLVDCSFCFAVAAGVCLLAWRLQRLSRWLLIVVFILIAANIDPRADLLFYIGILCWTLICRSSRALIGPASVLTLFAAFGILVKVNLLLWSALSLGLVASTWCVRRRFFAAIALLIGAAGALLAGWLAAGQSPANLPAYLSRVYQLSAAYNGAAALNALPALTARGLMVVAFLAAILTLRFAWLPGVETRRLRIEGSLLLLWTCGLVFLLWKHGFNRADLYHMGFFFGFAAILPFALDAIGAAPPGREPLAPPRADDPSSESPDLTRSRRHARCVFLARILGFVCCILVFSTLGSWFFAGLPEMLLAPLQNVSLNIRSLSHWSEWIEERNHAREAALSPTQLPPGVLASIGQSTVDVFGANQIYALHNKLNYHPRPVFQSYCALNAALNTLNERFFLGPRCPEFVLFNLNPLDHKFPPLEDSFVLRDLVFNYALVSSNAPCLVLKRRTTTPLRLTLVREGLVSMRKPIDLKGFASTNVWIEIEVAPTFAGRCRQFLFKPAPVRLVAWFNPGDLQANPLPGRTADAPGGREGNTQAPWKAPPPMLSAGFLGSPLLLDDRDVTNFLSGGSVRRPIAYSVELDPGSAAFWQHEIRYRIYTMPGTE